VVSENILGLSKKIFEWKKSFRSIYYVKIGEKEYIFRLLSKGEYLSLYLFQSELSYSAEDLLLDMCVLYPEISLNEIDRLYAGEVNTLISSILSLSGFSGLENIKEDLDKDRSSIQLLDNQITLIICRAFPHITPEDINNFDYPTIIRHITLAEALLDTKLEISELKDSQGIDFEKENKLQGIPPTPFSKNLSSKKLKK
jgi:hypothetical protein